MAVFLTSGFLVGCGQSNGTPGARAAAPAAMIDNAREPVRLGDSKALAAGTPVNVDISEVVDSSAASHLTFVIGSVVADVKGADGGVAIPARSFALLALREAGKQGNISRLVIGLNRIRVGDKYFMLHDGISDMSTLTFTEDSSQGPFHRAVHLQKHTSVTFKLDAPYQLN